MKENPIEKPLTAARDALQLAIKSLIKAHVSDGDPERLKIETAFEAARNALAGKAGAGREDLVAAKAALGRAVETLKFHKLDETANGAAVVKAYAAARQALEAIKPEE